MIMLFKAPWCSPCKEVDKLLTSMERDGLQVVRVDIEKDVGIAERYRIKSIPTTIKIVEGKEVDRVVGLVNRSWVLS